MCHLNLATEAGDQGDGGHHVDISRPRRYSTANNPAAMSGDTFGGLGKTARKTADGVADAIEKHANYGTVPTPKDGGQKREDIARFDSHATMQEQMKRRQEVKYLMAGHAHWQGLKWLAASYAVTAVGLVVANQRVPAFRTAMHLPQKVGVSLMPPIGVYGLVSSMELDRVRVHYQTTGELPLQPPKLAYWSRWFYTDPNSY